MTNKPSVDYINIEDLLKADHKGLEKDRIMTALQNTSNEISAMMARGCSPQDYSALKILLTAINESMALVQTQWSECHISK